MSNASSKEPAPTKSVMKTPWNPWLGLLFVVVVFYTAQITGGLLVSIVPSFRDFDSVGAQFAFILAAESLSIGALYLFLRRYKLGFAAIGLRKPKWSDLGYGLMSVPVYFLIYVVTVAVVTHLIPGLDIHQEQQLGFDDVKGALPLILTFISLVVLPPLTEELLVRGFLYSSLKKAMPLV
ncbi:MAG TPA: hypothetical protein VK534_02375, partial [Methylomirabilota bacterium]|nr:hypothetical protein [Methylomirabilota bacterium]